MRRIAGILLALSLAMPAALAANTAPQPLSSLLPGPGKTAGVDLANECKSGSILPVANGGTGGSSGPNLTASTGMVAQTAASSYSARTITAGTGISVANGSGVSGNPTITNAGVTSAVAGTGIGVSGATGAVTISNSGVTSNVAGFGISVSGATGAVTVSSNPVTGTAVLSSGTSGTITNASVTTNSIIMVTYKGTLVSAGKLSVTPGAGSFTIDSDSGTDASTVMYHIVKY